MINLTGFPKISCVLVTSGRVSLLKKSVSDYVNQSYKNKELIVVCKASSTMNCEIQTYLNSFERDDILFVEAAQDASLGALRNLAIELTTGCIICQWNDDDAHHPYRLATQYHTLLSRGVVASLYEQYLKFYVDSGYLYWIDLSDVHTERFRYLSGTIMFRKEIFYESNNMLYSERPEFERDVDLEVLEKISRLGKLAGVKQGFQYISIYHGENLCPKEYHELPLRRRVMNREFLLEHQHVLCKSVELAKLDAKICSLEGVIFTIQKGSNE